MGEKQIIGLHALLADVRKLLESKMKGRRFWLRAELSQVHFHKSGHCYLQLSETLNGRLIAQCRGNIWQNSLERIRKELGEDLRHVIKKGNEVLCLAGIEFTEQYGLVVIVHHIDLRFSLGSMEQRRQETLDRLHAGGLIQKNKQHVLPEVIQNIAIVGSPQTAGITDLIRQLETNAYGYFFRYQVFPCPMQGDKAAAEICGRLRELRDSRCELIALVRGGGSRLDLEVFNAWEIAREIALHPKPVFTGIGHETDVSVADLVAHTHHKTPTALGSYLVERALRFDTRIQGVHSQLASAALNLAGERRSLLHKGVNRLALATKQLISDERNALSVTAETVFSLPAARLQQGRGDLSRLLQLVRHRSEGRIGQSLSRNGQMLELIIGYSRQLTRKHEHYLQGVMDLLPAYYPRQIMNKGYGIPLLGGELLGDRSLTPGTQLDLALHNRTLTLTFIKENRKIEDRR